MRKIIASVLCLVMILSLCACGGETAKTPAEKNDAVFLQNLAAALTARWVESDKGKPEGQSVSDYQVKLVSIEKEKLGAFSEYTFEDSRLKELAKDYFEALDNQEEGAKVYSSDITRYTKLFTTEGYNIRAKTIKLINDEYGLAIGSEKAATMEEMLLLGAKVIGFENLLNQEIVLENTGNDAVAIIENNSGFDIDGLRISVRLIDSDGVVVETVSDYLEYFAAGEKQRISVNIRGKEFKSLELSFGQNSTGMETKYVPVEYVDNMIITLELPELPAEYGYGSYGRARTKCVLDTVEYEVRSWSNGTADITLLVSGSKTYDKRDTRKALATNPVRANVKIIDDQGAVLATGSIYLDNLRTGDVFKDKECFIDSNLAPGSYILVIEDDLY